MANNRRNLILSVEHTGTRFVKNHLLRGETSSYYHLQPSTAAFLEGLLAKYDYTFVPLRHPLAVAWSWARKNMPLNLLLARFDFMVDLLADRDPIYIPVDAPDRMAYIVEARRRTGLKLDPGDWPKVGHDRSNCDYRLTPADLSTVLPGIARHSGFFGRFYAEV